MQLDDLRKKMSRKTKFGIVDKVFWILWAAQIEMFPDAYFLINLF